LNEEKVEYLVVGAHAVIFYAEPRYTKDLDVWVNSTRKNAQKLLRALSRFGAPLESVTVEDFQNTELIYQIGVAPNRIDICIGIAGIDFKSAYVNKIRSTYDGVPITIIGKEDLIKSKKAAARAQDILDIENLENH